MQAHLARRLALTLEVTNSKLRVRGTRVSSPCGFSPPHIQPFSQAKTERIAARLCELRDNTLRYSHSQPATHRMLESHAEDAGAVMTPGLIGDTSREEEESRVGTKATRTKSRVKTKGKQKSREQGTITGARVTKATTRRATKLLDEEPLGLEHATPRRLDWTPPKADKDFLIDLTCDDSVCEPNEAKTALRAMLGGFGCGPGTIAAANAARQGRLNSAPLKKRQLDMVPVTSNTTQPVKGSVAKKKEKAPKKKAQTITELATKDFLPLESVEKTSFMDGFLSQTPAGGPTIGMPEGDRILAEAMETAKQRDSRLDRTSKVTASRLLSPEKAIEAVDSQDFLFGTSSQLVREDSPTFIRDLQLALRESEASASQEKLESQASVLKTKQSLWEASSRDVDGSVLKPEVLDLTKAVGVKASRYVPSVGAFETTPSLQAPVNLGPSLMPAPTDGECASIPLKPFQRTSHGPIDEIRDGVSLPRSLAEAACRERSRSKSPAKKNFLTKKAAPAKKVASAKKASSRKRKSDGDDGLSVRAGPSATDYNSWTVAQLAKKVKSYGFKAVKGKSAMVALLEKCSASTARQALQPLETNKALSHCAPDDNTGPVKPKRVRKSKNADGDGGDDRSKQVSPKKRGRPRKVDASGNATGCNVPCSIVAPGEDTPGLGVQPDAGPAADITPSAGNAQEEPPTSAERCDATMIRHPGLAYATGSDVLQQTSGVQPSRDHDMHMSAADNDLDNVLAPHVGAANEDEQPNGRLLEAITRAVTSYPPTHDPKKPSWYEKILMYDPIVLEDLATWLNTEGLGRIGIDEEVWPTLVRQWCEQRSVCCLWRENLRGGTRSRY